MNANNNETPIEYSGLSDRAIAYLHAKHIRTMHEALGYYLACCEHSWDLDYSVAGELEQVLFPPLSVPKETYGPRAWGVVLGLRA